MMMRIFFGHFFFNFFFSLVTLGTQCPPPLSSVPRPRLLALAVRHSLLALPPSLSLFLFLLCGLWTAGAGEGWLGFGTCACAVLHCVAHTSLTLRRTRRAACESPLQRDSGLRLSLQLGPGRCERHASSAPELAAHVQLTSVFLFFHYRLIFIAFHIPAYSGLCTLGSLFSHHFLFFFLSLSLFSFPSKFFCMSFCPLSGRYAIRALQSLKNANISVNIPRIALPVSFELERHLVLPAAAAPCLFL